mgnify:CR=1 FL=1
MTDPQPQESAEVAVASLDRELCRPGVRSALEPTETRMLRAREDLPRTVQTLDRVNAVANVVEL